MSSGCKKKHLLIGVLLNDYMKRQVRLLSHYRAFNLLDLKIEATDTLLVS